MFLYRSLSTNASSTRALNLKATILRKLGHRDTAAEAAFSALAVDPLDLWARRELTQAGKEKPHILYFAPEKWNDDVQPYLEMAVGMAGTCRRLRENRLPRRRPVNR